MTTHEDTPGGAAGDEADAPMSRRRAPRPPSFVHVTQLSHLIAEARSYSQGVARADLVDSLSMGRNAVDRRLRTAVEMGLLVPAGRGMSTGGRAPEMWRFNPDAATMLALAVSYRQSTAALMSIGGEVLERVTWEAGLIDDPAAVVTTAIDHLTALRGSRPDLPAPWGLGASLPTPVDFRDGSIVPPVAGAGSGPSWTGYPARTRLAEALQMSVWVDDEVNMMALAAASRVGAPKDLLYVRVSLGLGMGIVSSGQVHRGAGAASGEIAHIQMSGAGGAACRCGRRGCLETVVSGGAMEDAATTPQVLKTSSYLREVMSEKDTIRDIDVFRGVAQGDRVCVRIATEAADRLAVVLAVVTTTYNPGEVVLGGDVTASGQLFGQVVSQALRRRVLPSTSERLRIRMGHPDDALIGACRLAADRLLSPHVMHVWLAQGSPVGVAELVTHRRQDA
ncbi:MULTISPECIES: ROK family protein [unclassified Actinomyces]|uniref:ROK family protein n=1 Tax=unclassified Actinomyces TaxID=2609248 RepID=UPI002017EA4D|nr:MULTISPECIES: ROK family protein [unclassified Actinomyces]MCL3777445.1 ROK family protein [Actinomyces sp. AC-20-1]MCL3789738.1 ROK family protein [Actinomyces sp. 187325]MCL3792124.1 ROK family protein [Actinomyces sp. 186855]MCL3794792.1 ROK family protein [Actinomyces sp. 217892]